MALRAIHIFLFCAGLAFAADKASEPLIDYRNLDNDMIVEAFRAGNHDPTMVNFYIFRVSLIGLVDADDQRQLEMPKRKRIDQPLGEFGQMTIGALSVLDVDKKGAKPIKFAVKGDDVRMVVAEMMKKHAVPESKVAVQVNIELIERQKKWYFLDVDAPVASAQYFALPYGSSEERKTTDKKLVLEDDFGLRSVLRVEYRVNKKADF